MDFQNCQSLTVALLLDLSVSSLLTFQPDVGKFLVGKGETSKIVCGTDHKALGSPALKLLTYLLYIYIFTAD